MALGIEPGFGSGGPSWPLAGLPDGFEPDDPDLDIPHGAIRNGVREAPERYFPTPRDNRITHTATEPLAPTKPHSFGRKWNLSIIASCIFHAAIAGFFLYAVDEAVLMEGADFSGVAYLGAGEDQLKAGELSDSTDDAVEVTMVTMLQAKPVETIEAEAVPVEEAAEPVEMAHAVTAEPERLQPETEPPLQQTTEAKAEPVTPQPAETAPVEAQQPVSTEVTPAEPVEKMPARTVTETVPEVLATDRVELVDDDNVVQKPAEVKAAETVETAEAVSAELPSAVETSESEKVESATVAASDTTKPEPSKSKPVEAVKPETQAVESKVQPTETSKVETVEVAKAQPIETKPVQPVEEVQPKTEAKQQKAEPRKNDEPVKKAEKKPNAERKTARKDSDEGKKVAEKAEAKPKKSGNGGKNQANTRRGQTDGQEQGDNRQASRGGSKKGAVGNAAVSNYPGKVRSKLARIARSVRAKGRGEVVVAFAVGSNGSVRSARVARSSGVASVDQAALNAVKKASPFPPIPSNAGRSSWEFSVPLAFVR